MDRRRQRFGAGAKEKEINMNVRSVLIWIAVVVVALMAWSLLPRGASAGVYAQTEIGIKAPCKRCGSKKPAPRFDAT